MIVGEGVDFPSYGGWAVEKNELRNLRFRTYYIHLAEL